MLCDGGASGEPLTASCLRTSHGQTRLHVEVSSPAALLCALHGDEAHGSEAARGGLLQAVLQIEGNTAGRRQLLSAVAQAADEAGSLLAASVLQLLGSCGRAHSPANILQVLQKAGGLKGLAAAMQVTEKLVALCGKKPTPQLLPTRLLTSRSRLVNQAAAAAFGVADVALGIGSGRSVAVPGSSSSHALPKRQQSTARARTSAAASHDTAAAPPPPPPLPPPLTDAVIIELLDCCLAMQQIAHMWLVLARHRIPPASTPAGSGSGGPAAATAEAAEAAKAAGARLFSTALSAMAVLAVAAVPAVAAAAEHAAALRAAQAELSERPTGEQPFQIVVHLLAAVTAPWAVGFPHDLLPPLVEDCCAVVAAAAAMDPIVQKRESDARSSLDLAALQRKMRAALCPSDRLRLQPMFKQVNEVLAGRRSLLYASVADMAAAAAAQRKQEAAEQAAKNQQLSLRAAEAEAAAQALLKEEQGAPVEAAAGGAGGAAQQAESKKAAKRARQRAEKAAAAAAAGQASDTPARSGVRDATLNTKAGSAAAKRNGAGAAEAQDAAGCAAELLRLMQLADERYATSVQGRKEQTQKRAK